MISLDKAIEFYNGYKERSGGTVDYNEFDEQMVKWLEELKSYKEKHEGWMWDEAEIKGYNKAIDDAKSVILQTLDNEILVDALHLRLEQLKEGASNGTDNQ